MNKTNENKGIAIIGMSCRFPGANNLREYWELISEGKNKFSTIPEDRLEKIDFRAVKVPYGAFIEKPYHFDNSLFKISENEAINMDPQQRIMLELALEAKENARIKEFSNNNVGVYIGANQRSYMDSIGSTFYRKQLVDEVRKFKSLDNISDSNKKLLFDELADLEQTIPVDSTTITGNISNMISSRISHEFNLHGPSFTIDTACSSALVAVHLACESLYKKECNLVFAGGVNLNLTPSIFLSMEAAEVISPSKKCVPFSQESDGILLGEGAGLVLLKRLEDAIKDGDQILSVIKGSGINNDGRSLGIMAPSWKGQLRLLENVYSRSAYDPTKISLIEAHGTSTRIGDSVEITVLENFFKKNKNTLSIGSSKSNIGHTLGASGIAGLIKTVLAIQNRKLPPTLYGDKVNPKWKLHEKGFKIQDKLEDWNSNGIRAAGVSAFGFGGTNAHVILEEPMNSIISNNTSKVISQFNRKKFNYDLFPGLKKAEQSLFSISWNEIQFPESEHKFNLDHYLLFSDDDPFQLKEFLNKENLNFTLIKSGTNFTRIGESIFEINLADENHLRWLFEGLEKNKIYGIIYSPFRNEEENASVTINESLFVKHLFKIAAELLNESKVWCITSHAEKLNTHESLSPHNHSLFCLFSAALNENSKLQGGLFDIDSISQGNISLLSKIIQQDFPKPLIIRENKIFEPVLSAIIKQTNSIKASFRKDGVYLILGGSSGIGEEIAKDIHNTFSTKIIISGTRKVEDLSDELTLKLNTGFEYIQSTVTDRQELNNLINRILEKYGKLNGIIFSAGAIKYGTLKMTSDHDLQRVLKVKLLGVQNLFEAIKDYRVDFVYLLSSASALSPSWSLGMSIYATANAYLNAFAERFSNSTTLWLSRSWSIWEDLGMSKNLGILDSSFMLPFKLGKAIGLFHTSLQYENTNLAIVNKLDAEKFTTSWLVRKSVEKIEKSVTIKTTEFKGNGTNSNDFATLLKELIYESTDIPISEINENESFSDLGVDSIGALEIVDLLESKLDISLNPTLLYEYDSIKRLSDYFDNLKKVDESKAFPLLPTQKVFYSNQIFYPDSPCNSLVRMSFDRQLDYSVLQEAWNILLQKHESLQLIFEMNDNGPIQKISNISLAKVEYLVVENLENSISKIEEIEKRMVHKIYQLNKAPLCDLCQIDLGKTKTVILLNAHHIITDAWSMTLLLKELLAIYEAISAGNLIDEEELGLTFSDFVTEFNNKKPDNNNELAKEYWVKELRGIEPINISKGTQNTCEVNNETIAYNYEIDIETSAFLKLRARERNATLFQLLLAGYFQTLQKVTVQNDVIIRLATENRDRTIKGIFNLTGCLADSIPLRINMKEQEELGETSAKIKVKLALSRQHKNISSLDFASLINTDNQCGPTGITPCGMSYVNIDFFLKKYKGEQPRVSTRAALPFTDLSLLCLKQNEKLHISWNYSASVLNEDDIKIFNQTFLKILKGENELETSIKHVDEVDALQLPQSILFPEKTLLYEKVFAACDLFKENTAINEDGKLLSYSSLKRKSIQLANALLSQEELCSENIGILEYPGTKATSGILGILAAGYTYIPLDPDWPIGRIEDIITHSGMNTLLTTSNHLKNFTKNNTLQKSINTILLLDDTSEKILNVKNFKILSYSQESQNNLLKKRVEISPEQTAYIMYTSGTTGLPKGVMVDHSSLAVFLSWISEEFEINRNDKFISTSSLGFGGSLRQIFSTLLAGGEMHPIDRFDFKDPQSLLHFLDENEISIINTVPSVLNNICEYLEQLSVSEEYPRLEKLRLMLIGGEILSGTLVQKWRNYFGQIHRIVNLYGSTETIVNATFYDVGNESDIPIGKARKGSHVLLLNEKEELCSKDEKGEIYVGGPSIAKGYYNDKDITKEKFVHLTLKGTKGIYYRTGDIAKKDKLGNYHFLGRNDNQIQLYGNRIEPAEIESVLTSSGFIKNASVLDFKEKQRHWIVAFIELENKSKNVNEIDIRNLVALKLPAYMVPQKIEFIQELPLTHAGKIDRLKLRENYNEHNSHENIVDDFNSTQTIIRNIWQKALGIENVELNQDFFSLGGDSILALEVLHNLRKAFTKTPKPVELFRKRTILELASSIDELNDTTEKGKVESIGISSTNKTNQSSKFPLSYTQKGFLLLNKLNPESSPNLVATLPIKGELDATIFQKALNLIIARHDMLRTRFITRGLKSFQEIGQICNVKIDFTDISKNTISEQKNEIQQRFNRFKKLNFDLSKTPLFKIEILSISENNSILIVAIHHIIGDAWSMKVLSDELLTVYDLLNEGTNSFLPKLQTSFFDLVHEESKQQFQSQEEIELQQDFWKKTFRGQPKIVLNKKFFSAENTSDKVFIHLSSTQKTQLKDTCTEKGISLFQLFFASYARALGKILETNRLLINTSISGRDLSIPDIEKIIGCFARSLPVNINFQEEDLFDNIKELNQSFLASSEFQNTSPKNILKIFNENGTESIHALYRFFISFMDFSSLGSVESSNLQLEWNKADFFFNTGSVEADLMIGIRVSDEVLINFNGQTNSRFKNQVKEYMEKDLQLFQDLNSPTNTNKIDSALIAYFPSIRSLSGILSLGKLSEQLAKDFVSKILPNNEPQLLEIEETRFGKTGVVFLPIFGDDLYTIKQTELLNMINKAILVCEQNGAKHISLAGNLPSKTNYCYSVLENIKSSSLQNHDLIITTGHSCTVVAVAKTIHKVLADLELEIKNQTLAVVGFGSIGQASLNLVLEKIGHPAKIIIADLASQMIALKNPLNTLKESFHGETEIVAVEGPIPDAVYSANIIIGASSHGKILEVDKILPGTIIVDDSFPHIVDTQKAIKRMKIKQDVVILGGGKIDIGKKKRLVLNSTLLEGFVNKIVKQFGDEGLPGCRVEPMMINYDELLPTTIGLVSSETAIKYWNRLSDLNIEAVGFHLQGFQVDDQLIKNVKKYQKYGSTKK